MIKTVGVIGAGIMGTDVALNLGFYDLKVVLLDVSQEVLDNARKKIGRGLKMTKMMLPAIHDLTSEVLFSRLTFTTDYSLLAEADLIIENVTEDWSIKESVYKKLVVSCKPETYYAVNTSCIPITKVAALLADPSRVIGAHFMNPVPLKKMVETVRGFHTSDETVALLSEFLKSIGKNPVIVNDYPGFVANRLSHLFMNEAACLVQDGVAEPRDIDEIFKQGYGHKMGPLETADLIGLDTVVNSLDVLYTEYQDPKFRCCPLLKKMIRAGLHGQKSGKGFYNY